MYNSPKTPKRVLRSCQAKHPRTRTESCKPTRSIMMKPVTLAVCLLLGTGMAVRAEPDTEAYRKAYAATMKDRLPCLVFVGQPAREISGTRSIAVKTFPDATSPCVVVGVVRDGEMLRKDFGSSASTQDIQAVIASLA